MNIKARFVSVSKVLEKGSFCYYVVDYCTGEKISFGLTDKQQVKKFLKHNCRQYRLLGEFK